MTFFRKAIFLIHGFSGDYTDNEYLLNELQFASNYDVYTITLPGHDKIKLKDIEYRDWILASEAMLIRLLNKYRHVYLIGHSMGGVIATHLANKYNVSKLALIAPAFSYINKEQIKSDLFKLKDLLTEDENYNAYQQFFHKLFHVDKSAVDEFKKLVNIYQNDIEKVNCPVLFVHGNIDEVVPKSSSVEAFKKVNHDKKYLFILKGVRHYPFKSNKKLEAYKIVYDFFKNKYKNSEINEFEI